MSLLKLKLAELKERCESLGIDHTGLHKKDLIELIKHALEVSTGTDQHDNDDGNDNDYDDELDEEEEDEERITRVLGSLKRFRFSN